VAGDGPGDSAIHEGPIQDPLPVEVVGQSFEAHYYRAGPLPDSQEFGEYERQVPGSGDRILTMAEEAARARNSSIIWLSRAEAISVTVVSIIFAVTPIVLGLVAMYLAVKGHQAEAIVTGVVAGVSAGPKLIAAIKGNNGSDRNDDE